MARRQNARLRSAGGTYELGEGMGDWRALALRRPVRPLQLGAYGATETPNAPPVQRLEPRPLARTQPALLGLSRVQLVLVALVVIVLIYLAYRLGKAQAATPMQAVRKMSTNRLSKALYERLERNGRGSERTRAALAQMGRDA